MSVNIDSLNIALLYGYDFSTLNTFKELLEAKVGSVHEVRGFDVSLHAIQDLAKWNIHGVLVGMFDLSGDGIHRVVEETKSSNPNVFVASLVPDMEIHTGAMLKAHYDQLETPFLVDSLLYEMANFLNK